MRLSCAAAFGLFLYLATASVSHGQSLHITENEVGSVPADFSCYDEKKTRIPFSICYRDLKTTNSDDVVYFFHDMDSDEKDWFKSVNGLPQVQRIWDQAGYRPRVVSLSFGRRKLLVKNVATPEHAFFLKEAIPFIENEILGGLRNGKRHIIGQAAGALSVSNVALRKEMQFATVSLLCPAFTDLNPYATEKFASKYIEDNHLDVGLVLKLQKILKENYLSGGDWDGNNVNLLLSKFGPKMRPAIYVSAGSSGGYGFELGTETFITTAKRLGFHPTWEQTNGRHCSYREQGFANFILNESH